MNKKVSQHVGKRVLFLQNGVVGFYKEGFILKMSDSEEYVKIDINGEAQWYSANDISVVDTLEK